MTTPNSHDEYSAANERRLIHDLHREVEDQHAHAVIHGESAAKGYVRRGAVHGGGKAPDRIPAGDAARIRVWRQRGYIAWFIVLVIWPAVLLAPLYIPELRS